MTTFREQCGRILFHCTSAALVWFVIALTVERLIPGFISPLVDLPDLGIVLLAFVILSLVCSPPKDHRVSRMSFLVCTIAASVLGLSFFWLRVNDYGRYGLGELGVVVLIVILFIYSFLHESHYEA